MAHQPRPDAFFSAGGSSILTDPRRILLPHFVRHIAPERTEEWLRVFGVKAPASTMHHYQFYLHDYETDPSTQPWLLWPLATKLWSIYHEFFAQLTPELQYAMRLYIDCVLATTEPEDVFRFPLRRSDGPLPLHRVPSQDSLPIEPRLALYHHVDKWIYHSRRLTAAQENRIPYLKLIRRCRPQKFNANKEFVTRDLTENDKRVLRHWTLVTRLGNYRHAHVPSLGTSLRERQLVLSASASTVLTTLACREFLVYAVHDDPALFKTMDQQRHGAWTRYRHATIKAADGYRLSAEPPTAYFKETQGDLARLMIPVSFWEATLPLFRRLGVPYDVVSPEFVARMASVFRYAQGRRIEWHKSLIESIPFSSLQAKEKLVEIMTRYYSSVATWNVLDWSQENNKEDLDLLYSLCLAQYYAKTVFLVSLESHVLDAQFDALMHRSRGDADVATKAMQFVACPSCFKEHSMVCRPLPGSSSTSTTTTTTRRRKRAKVFTASAVAGLSKVRINIHSMEVYCGRKSGKKRSQCMRAPVCRFPLLGQLLCFRGVFYTLCTRPECGIVTVFDPVTSKTSDPVCASCSSSSSVVKTNNNNEEEDLYYYDYSDEDLDPETGEPELYRGVRIKRKYKKKT